MDFLVEKIGGVVLVFVIILASMTLHELMHGFVAFKLGDDTAKNEGRLSLNPIKHLDPVYSIIVPITMFLLGGPIFGGAKPVPVDFSRVKGGVWGMAAVALAGPLTNLILAFLGFLLYFFASNEFVSYVSFYFMSVNLGFCCFNMLPIPPLDGSRVLYAILPDGIRNIFDNLERGMGVWLVYIIIFVFSGVFSGIIGTMINFIYHLFLMMFGV